MVISTNNTRILNYVFRKLYHAIIINNCNRYSSILNKQKIDIVMVDDNFKILSIKRKMNENTIYENKNASKVVLLPLGMFDDLVVDDYFTVE